MLQTDPPTKGHLLWPLSSMHSSEFKLSSCGRRSSAVLLSYKRKHVSSFIYEAKTIPLGDTVILTWSSSLRNLLDIGYYSSKFRICPDGWKSLDHCPHPHNSVFLGQFHYSSVVLSDTITTWRVVTLVLVIHLHNCDWVQLGAILRLFTHVMGLR